MCKMSQSMRMSLPEHNLCTVMNTHNNMKNDLKSAWIYPYYFETMLMTFYTFKKHFASLHPGNNDTQLSCAQVLHACSRAGRLVTRFVGQLYFNFPICRHTQWSLVHDFASLHPRRECKSFKKRATTRRFVLTVLRESGVVATWH